MTCLHSPFHTHSLPYFFTLFLYSRTHIYPLTHSPCSTSLHHSHSLIPVAAHLSSHSHSLTPIAAHPSSHSHSLTPAAAHPSSRSHLLTPMAAHPSSHSHLLTPMAAHPSSHSHSLTHHSPVPIWLPGEALDGDQQHRCTLWCKHWHVCHHR